MTGTELATYQPGGLSEEMDYARAVSVASMLPDNYRNKPADIMLAVGLGRSMGLSPAESLYRISVIKGKPTASAELIAANVRKAGHRLRVSGDDTSATCTIIRADDPDYEFTVTRDMAWAQRMGLARNDNYAKQAGTMLQWRAITACARLACPEALYGVAYSADEMDDMSRATVTATQEPGPDRMATLLADAPPSEPVEAEVVEGSPLINTRSNLAKRLFASVQAEGIVKDQFHAFFTSALGREVNSASDLTDADAEEMLDNLPALAADFLAEVATLTGGSA